MTASNFPNVLPVTLAYEGGKSLVRSDPGNWTGGKVGRGELRGTNKGIAASAHANLDIMKLTDDEVAQIYETEYWKPSGACLLPNGLDLSSFDLTVNSGVGRNATVMASVGTAGSVSERISRVADQRLGFLHRLSTFRTFGKGWTARVAGVEAKSLKMDMMAAHLPAYGTVDDAKKDAAITLVQKAASHTVQAKQKATASASAVVSGPAAAAVTHGSYGAAVTAAILIVALVAAIAAGIIAFEHSQRASAMMAEAKK
jgi:lysozyme family protein